jgi:hypothetical protein
VNGDLRPDNRKKADFFKNGRFRIILTPFELSNRILVPGHRFIPFLRPDRRPWNVVITTADNIKLGKKIIKANPEKIKSFFSLFGEENFLFMLIDDRPENSNLILNNSDSPGELEMTVFDLSPIIRDYEEKADVRQALMLEISDWEKGVYKINKAEKTDSDNADYAQYVGEWTERLEKGFKTVFAKTRAGKTVPDIMSDAFITAGPDSIKNPPLSLEEFFDISDIHDIADLIAQGKENPEIFEKKKFIKSRTLKVIKILTSWLETSTEEDDAGLLENMRILEKQVLITKKSLIAVLEELNNPFITDETINTMLEVITETEHFISSLEEKVQPE